MNGSICNFPMQNNKGSTVSIYADKVSEIIKRHQYRRVVLQMDRDILGVSFELTSLVRAKCPDTHCFVLYDSLKQSCCTDVLGAEHVNYDGLVHFGPACFSEQHQPNHHYIFQQPDPQIAQAMIQTLTKEETLGFMNKNEIGYVMVEQKYYELVKEKVFRNYRLGQSDIQLLRLPFDKEEKDEYLIFGYYGGVEKEKNILVMGDEVAQGMSLMQQLSFAVKGLKSRVGQQIFGMNMRQKQIELANLNNNKLLMQRYSLISQLDQYKVFGLIVSNTSTSFHLRSAQRCRSLLTGCGKKVFSFLMNNLNEMKLGNFPEIEVYVVISCFNHSLFSIKQFHRLVVTPNDLEVAFEGRAFDQYMYDCAAEKVAEGKGKEEKEDKKEDKKEEKEAGMQVDKQQHSELMLQQKIQTLQFYRDREFKGLQFQEKKQVQKLKKGKIGLAESYKPLE